MRLLQGLLNIWNSMKGQSIPHEQKLSKDAVTALIIHSCFQLGASMSGLFLNLYLWRLTEDLFINAVYNIVMFAITPVAFAVGGWISKKYDRMLTYRIGIVMVAFFYLMVIIAQEQVPNYYIWFAIFNGVATGFYWTGYLVLQYDVTTDVNRIRFLAINLIMFNTAGLIGPALAGFIIGRNDGLQGYIIIFILAFIMFVIAALISFNIPIVKSHHKAYYLKLMGTVMGRNKRWLKGLYCFVVLGLFQGIMLFLPNIMLFQAVKREDWVGYLGVIFSALTVLAGYIVSIKTQKESVRGFIFLSITGVVAGAALLLIEIQIWSVVLFMALYSICYPLVLNMINSYFYQLIGTLPLKGQLRIESVVMREVFLNFGRVLSITLIVFLAADIQSKWMPFILFAMAALQYMLLLLIQEKEPEVQRK